MKAFVCTEFGPADGCRVRDIDIESPGKDQVMIEIRSASLNFQAQRRNMETLARWFAEGRIKPFIDSTVSLARIPAAIKRLQARKVKGKVVVRVQVG